MTECTLVCLWQSEVNCLCLGFVEFAAKLARMPHRRQNVSMFVYFSAQRLCMRLHFDPNSKSIHIECTQQHLLYYDFTMRMVWKSCRLQSFGYEIAHDERIVARLRWSYLLWTSQFLNSLLWISFDVIDTDNSVIFSLIKRQKHVKYIATESRYEITMMSNISCRARQLISDFLLLLDFAKREKNETFLFTWNIRWKFQISKKIAKCAIFEQNQDS